MDQRSASTREPASPCEVSVVMPCLNESATIESCVKEALVAIESAGLRGEVLVADNGSTDGSQAIASEAGARVVQVELKGYGHALMGGIRASRGEIVVMGDADSSYDFSDTPHFVSAVREGYDLVMGNRFKGGIDKGAMPWKNRYVGNPILSGIGRLFFGGRIRDFHCGLRAFTRDAFERMELNTGGMEFASEMVIKSILLEMRVTEIPTKLRPDGRGRAPHLRPWRDGWRHLRFMLLFSPNWLFLYPGLALVIGGAVATTMLVEGPQTIGGITFDVHTLVFSAAAMVIGLQSMAFWALTRTFAAQSGLIPGYAPGQTPAPRMRLEAGVAIGLLIALAGLAVSGFAVYYWGQRSFGGLDPTVVLRWVIPGAAFLTMGLQIVLFSFFLGVLRLDLRR